MVYSLFDKKSSGSGVDVSLANKSATEPNYQLANELHKQIIRKLNRQKKYSSFRDNIWGADLADMQSLSKTNKETSIYCVQLICLVNVRGCSFKRQKRSYYC